MFDHLVHVRDKDGRVIKENNYVVHFSRDGMFYERDGVKFHPDGTPHPGQQAEPSIAKAKEDKVEKGTTSGFVPKDKR